MPEAFNAYSSRSHLPPAPNRHNSSRETPADEPWETLLQALEIWGCHRALPFPSEGRAGRGAHDCTPALRGHGQHSQRLCAFSKRAMGRLQQARRRQMLPPASPGGGLDTREGRAGEGGLFVPQVTRGLG